jgi:hypothetical protein
LARTEDRLIPCLRRELLIRSRQAPISMGLGAWLPGAKLTLLSWLSATSGAPHRHCLLLGDLHGYMMRVCWAASWSLLTSSKRDPKFLARCEMAETGAASAFHREGVPRMAAATGPNVSLSGDQSQSAHRRRGPDGPSLLLVEVTIQQLAILRSNPRGVVVDFGPFMLRCAIKRLHIDISICICYS